LHLTGKRDSSPSPVQRTRSLDRSTQNTALPSPSSGGRQTAGRKRDRASTIRASDYMAKPVSSVPGSGETTARAVALTTRTRSGTIRPLRPPLASLAGGFPLAIPQSCAGQRPTPGAPLDDSLALVGSDKKSLDCSGSQSEQMSRISGVRATESMVVDMLDGESDDELLLDHKGWNWDGRWD
jgi:hypothetical protein